MSPKALFHIPDCDAVWNELNAFDEVIVRTQGLDAVPRILDKAQPRNIVVNTVIAEIDSLAGFIRGLDVRLFMDQYTSQYQFALILEADRIGTTAELIHFSERLAHASVRAKLPLRNAADGESIKILSSLDIQILIDLRQADLDWAQLEDLLTDHLLALVDRPSLDPFRMLATICEKKDFGFSLASIHLDDFRQYLHIDEHKRLYLCRADVVSGRAVDLPLRDKARIAKTDLYKKRLQTRLTHLREKTFCAFCEGFNLCQGYLWKDGQTPLCRAFFKSFFETFDFYIKKSEKAKGKAKSGPAAVSADSRPDASASYRRKSEKPE